ncbi:hypothetical protein Tco_0034155 [Tanacetum coccineum]
MNGSLTLSMGSEGVGGAESLVRKDGANTWSNVNWKAYDDHLKYVQPNESHKDGNQELCDYDSERMMIWVGLQESGKAIKGSGKTTRETTITITITTTTSTTEHITANFRNNNLTSNKTGDRINRQGIMRAAPTAWKDFCPGNLQNVYRVHTYSNPGSCPSKVPEMPKIGNMEKGLLEELGLRVHITFISGVKRFDDGDVIFTFFDRISSSSVAVVLRKLDHGFEAHLLLDIQFIGMRISMYYDSDETCSGGTDGIKERHCSGVR